MFHGEGVERVGEGRAERPHYRHGHLGDAVRRSDRPTVRRGGCYVDEDGGESHIEENREECLDEDHHIYSRGNISIMFRPKAHHREERKDGETRRKTGVEDAFTAVAIMYTGKAEDLEETVADAVDGETDADGCGWETETAERDGSGEEDRHDTSVGDVDEGNHGIVECGDEDAGGE